MPDGQDGKISPTISYIYGRLGILKNGVERRVSSSPTGGATCCMTVPAVPGREAEVRWDKSVSWRGQASGRARVSGRVFDQPPVPLTTRFVVI